MRANRRFIPIAMFGVLTLAACTSKPAAAERLLSPIEAPAAVTAPVAATVNAACPRTTTFSASISVPRGPRVVSYEWRTSTGTSLGAGSVTFGKNGPFTYTVTSESAPVDRGLTVTLAITEPSGTTAAGIATCA